MQRAVTLFQQLSRRGGRVLGGLAAVMLLLPVPAMALTFTSAWQSATVVSGGPTPSKPTFTDVTNNTGKGSDSLIVNMPDYQGVTKTAVESIGLARSITVPGGSAGEAIQFAEQFAAQFKQAGVALTVAIFDSKGNLVANPINFSQSTNSTSFVTISNSQSVKNTIKGGNYTLTVGLAYATNNKIGGWKAISNTHIGFQFTGL